MNVWCWPFPVGPGTEVSYVARDPVLANLHRFGLSTVLTIGWDTGRALTNVVLIAVTGPAVLAALRRAVRRAAFGATATITPAPAGMRRTSMVTSRTGPRS